MPAIIYASLEAGAHLTAAKMSAAILAAIDVRRLLAGVSNFSRYAFSE